MANEKKVVLLNRGKRHFQVSGSRRVAPGETVEVDQDEAKKLTIYPDLVDLSKVSVKVDESKLKTDNAALMSENAELKKKLAEKDEAAESGKEPAMAGGKGKAR